MPLSLLSAAKNPRMFSWVIIASWNQDHSSQKEKIFTATSPPLQQPCHTSLNWTLLMISYKMIVQTTVHQTQSGCDHDVQRWSSKSWIGLSLKRHISQEGPSMPSLAVVIHTLMIVNDKEDNNDEEELEED
jgi:hypothetical protein